MTGRRFYNLSMVRSPLLYWKLAGTRQITLPRTSYQHTNNNPYHQHKVFPSSWSVPAALNNGHGLIRKGVTNIRKGKGYISAYEARSYWWKVQEQTVRQVYFSYLLNCLKSNDNILLTWGCWKSLAHKIQAQNTYWSTY